MNDTVLALVILPFTKLQALKGSWIKLETPALHNYLYVPLVLGRTASGFGWGPALQDEIFVPLCEASNVVTRRSQQYLFASSDSKC